MEGRARENIFGTGRSFAGFNGFNDYLRHLSGEVRIPERQNVSNKPEIVKDIEKYVLEDNANFLKNTLDNYKGEDKQERENYALRFSAAHNKIGCLVFFRASCRADVLACGSKTKKIALHFAAQKGYSRALDILLKTEDTKSLLVALKQLNFGEVGSRPVDIIVGQADPEKRLTMIKLSLDAIYQQNNKDIYHTVVDTLKQSSLNTLLKKYESDNVDLALRKASDKGNARDVDMLVNFHNANVNSESSNGLAAIGWAYTKGHMQIVYALHNMQLEQSELGSLLGKYASSSEKNNWPQKDEALFKAIKAGNLADVKLLVTQYKASLTTVNDNHQTPIAYAQSLDKKEILSWLHEAHKQQKAKAKA